MDQKPPFIIFALPRSRTLWLSHFLTYGEWRCGHEDAMTLRSIGDIKDYFSRPNVGTAETAASPGWHLLRHYVPTINAVVIRRPLEETVDAMIAAGKVGGVTYDHDKLRKVMSYGNRMLDQISASPGSLTVSYDDLKSEKSCALIFEHCLPYNFDRLWWNKMKDRNIQIDLRKYFADYFLVRDQIEEFKRLCKRDLVRLARAGKVAHA